MKERCPCGRKNCYSACCGSIHKDITLAHTAQDLMRSRYSAFTKGLGDYLMLSHHSSTRPISEKNEIVDWANSVEWDRLEIVNTNKGLANDKEGIVEFKAYFFTKRLGVKKRECIHERSRFIKENRHWTYVEALDL